MREAQETGETVFKREKEINEQHTCIDQNLTGMLFINVCSVFVPLNEYLY